MLWNMKYDWYKFNWVISGLVPAAIKREMLQKLKDEILTEAGYYDPWILPAFGMCHLS